MAVLDSINIRTVLVTFVIMKRTLGWKVNGNFFFATSHRKGASDGIRGTVKRFVASLYRPDPEQRSYDGVLHFRRAQRLLHLFHALSWTFLVISLAK